MKGPRTPIPFSLLAESIGYYDDHIRREADGLLPPDWDTISIWTQPLRAIDGRIALALPPEYPVIQGIIQADGINYYTIPFHLIYEENNE